MPSPQVIITPESTTSQLAEGLMELQRILTRGLGVGDSGQGTNLPRRAAPVPLRPDTRLGRTDNLYGSLVEVTLTAAADLGTNIRVAHNLRQPAPAQTTPVRNRKLNVRWIPMGVRYLTSNYAADLPVVADHRVLVLYADGTVSEDEIELRFYTDLVIAGANNAALVVSLFFTPASA